MHEGNDGYSTSSHSSDDEAGDMITPLTSAAQKMSVDDFDLLAVVGKGSFGKVMQVRHKRTGQIYAMKVLKKKELIKRKQVLHTRTERNVLVDVTHPFVVSLRAAFQTRGKLYMLLDYFNGGELFFHLRNDGQFSEERCRFYAAQIILALKCLHENGVVYRDLKPENILLDSEGFIKITDFGLSKDAMADGKLTHTFCGTPEYLAPEVLRNEGHARAVDWWSLGTLLFEMMTGLPPFYDTNIDAMYEKILNDPLVFPPEMSMDARDLFVRLLERDPAHRLGSGEDDAEELMRHPFFESVRWDALLKKQVEPPYVPAVTSKVDLRNVDEEFLQEAPSDTPIVCTGSVLKASDAFPNFTYQPETGLAQHNPDEDDFPDF
ncbi:MAG: hypothetical protein MHM6MM_004569 [Cercozoa sp. M6MM]